LQLSGFSRGIIIENGTIGNTVNYNKMGDSALGVEIKAQK